MKRVLINGFELLGKIGSGSFSRVYVAKSDEERVAIKTGNSERDFFMLTHEAETYKILRGLDGIPNYKWHGYHQGKNYLCIELLGPNIDNLFHKMGCRFSLKTILMISLRMISVLREIHQRNLVHCDIKPKNILIGGKNMKDKIYLVDFGLSQQYRDEKTGNHRGKQLSCPLVGTPRYCSLNHHRGITISRRDDFESLAYLLLFLAKGSLPWQISKAKTLSTSLDQIYETKKSIPPIALCEGLPCGFCDFLESIRGLRYNEEPNYESYIKLFQTMMKDLKYIDDGDFDWLSLPKTDLRVHKESISHYYKKNPEPSNLFWQNRIYSIVKS